MAPGHGVQLLLQGRAHGRRDRPRFHLRGGIAAACRAAAESPAAIGNIHNLGGGSRVSVNAAVARWGRFVGKPLNVRYEATVSGDVRDTGADTTPGRSDVVFDSQTSFEDGCARRSVTSRR